MARASFAKEDLFELKGRGFGEGWGEIVGAKSAVVQWQPKKGTTDQKPPLTALILDIQRTNDKGDPTPDAPVEQELVVEWGRDGEPLKVRPGHATSQADDNPEDLGDTVGTEGNCLFVEEGQKIRMDNTAGLFLVSLQDHGFKPQVLGAGYLPDLIGTRAFFKNVPGRKYKNQAGAEIQTDSFVADKIVQFPYEKGASKKKTTATTTTATAVAKPKVNGAARIENSVVPPTPAADTQEDTGVEPLAIAACQAVVAKNAAAGEMRKPRFDVELFQHIVKVAKHSKEECAAIQKLTKNAEWIDANAAEIGAVLNGDTIQFMSA